MPEIYNCELWERAKIRAQERGLSMSGSCPIERHCSGAWCNIVRFNDDEQKLEKLREELKELNGTVR